MSEVRNSLSEADQWKTDEDYWTTLAPIMFDEQRWKDAPHEIEQIVTLLGVKPEAAILDLCCGPGRHSLALARHGLRVTGVDRKPEYLESARKQAEVEGLRVEFVQDDMRYFCRPDGFDAAVNLYTSFGYFDNPAEDRQVLVNMHRSLRDGGALLIEMVGKEVLARDFRGRWWGELDDGAILLLEEKISGNWTWFERRWILIKDQSRQDFQFAHRLYSAAELSALLLECGFRFVDVYGDLTSAPYDNTAKRLVVVAHK